MATGETDLKGQKSEVVATGETNLEAREELDVFSQREKTFGSGSACCGGRRKVALQRSS